MLQNVSTKTVQRLLLAGIIGSLVMFSGDMLLYFDPAHAEMTPESIDAVMRKLNPYRVMAGGAVGPFAACLYCFGYAGLACLIRKEHPKMRAAVFLLFFISAVYGGGSYHSLFPPKAFAVAADGIGVIPLVEEYLDIVGWFAFGVLALASLVFQYAVIRGYTHCRKHMAIVAPLPLGFLIFGMIHLPPPFLIVLAGGWYCLMITIFFTACLIESGRR